MRGKISMSEDLEEAKEKGANLYKDWKRYHQSNPKNAASRDAIIGCKGIYKGKRPLMNACKEGAEDARYEDK